MRKLARVLVGVSLLSLAACAASGSASPDLIGPYPSVTAVIRANADGGRLELLGVRVSPVELRSAATQLAGDLFGPENIGEASPTTAEDGATKDALLSTSVPVTIPDAGLQLPIDEATVDAALAPLKPRSNAVWACSERRTVEVASQAPGAVSSDAVSGSCQVVGSSIADDGVDWSATLTIGPVTDASLGPERIGGALVLVLVAALVAVVLIRRAGRKADVPPPGATPVH